MNIPPQNIKEVFLCPGEFFFGEANTRIRTLLGSCVAITLWHPQRRIGGMCHYMLSDPHLIKHHRRKQLDGRYAEDAIQLFLKEIAKTKTHQNEYQVKIFGGGNMFANVTKGKLENIGERNVRIGRELLKNFGFNVCTEHLGGEGYRRLVFDLWSGDVWMKHTQFSPEHPAEKKQYG